MNTSRSGSCDTTEDSGTVRDFAATIFFTFSLCAALLLVSCNNNDVPPAGIPQAKQAVAPSSPAPPSSTTALSLPLNFEHRTGDLDEMVKRRNIRVLVLLNPIRFFYDKGMPRGAVYEALEEFQKFANK